MMAIVNQTTKIKPNALIPISNIPNISLVRIRSLKNRVVINKLKISSIWPKALT